MIITREEAVRRARSAVGYGTVYTLGKGGYQPIMLHPGHLCDCSGFAVWDLGQARQQPDGVWEGTDEISADAIHDTALSDGHDLFSSVPWEKALPGDLLVWKGMGGHHGHVGMVGSIGPSGPETVIHCSSGNYRRFNDAIHETGTELFATMHAVVARWKGFA